MTQKNFNTIAGTIFLIVSVVHVLRLLLGWDFIIGSWHTPLWVSWAGLAIAGFLAYAAFSKKS